METNGNKLKKTIKTLKDISRQNGCERLVEIVDHSFPFEANTSINGLLIDKELVETSGLCLEGRQSIANETLVFRH